LEVRIVRYQIRHHHISALRAEQRLAEISARFAFHF